MADLIRTLEADLFGAYEWSAELYGELADVPEPAERRAVHEGLLRAYEALERPEDAMRAADALAAAEDAVEEPARAALARLAPARDALLDEFSVERARAFLAAFEPAWADGPRGALVFDAVLAALARSNVLAARLRGTIPREEEAALHRAAARTYEEVADILRSRVADGEAVWQETAQSALFRAARAWTLAGDEEAAKRADSGAAQVDV